MANGKQMALITAGVLGLSVLGGCDGVSDGTATSSSKPASTTTGQAGAVVEASGASCGDPTEASGFEVPASEGVVPDVVCMDLQLAQDKMQAADFFGIRSVDESGQSRIQGWDRNWLVVAQQPAAGDRAASATTIVLRAVKYGEGGAPPLFDASKPASIPKVVCFDLQEAQDTLQAAGFLVTTSDDATGAGRVQLVDRNWRVTGQTPAPGGAHEKSTSIRLQAVKDGEPDSCS